MSYISDSFENISKAIKAAGEMLESENVDLRNEIVILQQQNKKQKAFMTQLKSLIAQFEEDQDGTIY